MVDFVYSEKNPEAPLAYCEIMAMHSRLELLLIGKGEERTRALCEEAERTTLGLEKIFDRHNPDSEISALNTAEGGIHVGDELYFALELCEQFRRATDGFFDISACSPVPTSDRGAYSLGGEDHCACLSGKGIVLDFGGFAKGYALEKIRSSLASAGIRDALLNFGNSSAVGMGKHPFGPCWIINSDNGTRSFRLCDSAVSISGRSPDGKDHIINPASGKSAKAGKNIAVEGKSALVCEILSTALYAAPESSRADIIKNFEGYSFI